MIELNLEATDTQDVARYNASTTTHNFEILDMSIEYKKELDELLAEENIGNGDFSAYGYNGRLMGITYETTDSYEFAEVFAEELAELVADAIATLANRNGGYKTLCE